MHRSLRRSDARPSGNVRFLHRNANPCVDGHACRQAASPPGSAGHRRPADFIHAQGTAMNDENTRVLGRTLAIEEMRVFADQCGCNLAFSGSGGRKLAMILSLR
jgi:hypothetical protein